VEIYERRDFNVEVGASISCAANGTQWLREWEVDIPDMKPVILVRVLALAPLLKFRYLMSIFR
jgi:salicylate hydroxylase